MSYLSSYLKKIILALILVVFSGILYAQESLVFAFDLIRHGDRTPLAVIPTAPHTWAEGMGQLTAIGMQQEWQRGSELRKKYVDYYHLLPAHFQPDTIYVFSTDFDRTLMSAESVLLGLYPLGNGPFLAGSNEPALPNAYQPIPIHTEPVDAITDSLISDGDQAIYQQYVASRPEMRKKTAELQNKFTAWSKATGLHLSTLSQLGLLKDALLAYQVHHVPMPVGLSNNDIKEIIDTAVWEMATKYKTEEITNFVGRRLLTKIANYILAASQHKTSLKYVLFLGHDKMIMSVMTTLQAPLDIQPPYAADLNFALFKTDAGDYVVKVNYNEKPVNIPACGGASCALAQFIKLVK